MSETVKNLGGGTTVQKAGTTRIQKLGDRQDKTSVEAMSAAERAKEKERILQVLGMGLVTDAIRVDDADPNRRYAYVRERDIDIKKFEALGYTVERAAGKGEHGTGSDLRRVGDAILMSIPRERYDLIQEVRAERTAQKMGKPQREYKEQSQKGVSIGTAVEPIDLTEGD